MKIIINGKSIKSEADFHKIWRESFDISHVYGNNLDALRDSLLGSIERPIEILWQNSSFSKAQIGDVFQAIISTFDEAVQNDKEYDFKDKFAYTLK